MDYSDLLLKHPGAVDEAGLAIAAHLMDLVSLGLGARGDVAASARRGGTRRILLPSARPRVSPDPARRTGRPGSPRARAGPARNCLDGVETISRP